MSSKVVQGVGKVAHLYKPSTWREKGLPWTIGLFFMTLVVIMVIVGIVWSNEPDTFDVREAALNQFGHTTEEIAAEQNEADATEDTSAQAENAEQGDATSEPATAQPVITPPAQMVTGYVTTATVIQLMNNLLDKTGGYITNDIMVPGLYLDNIKNWEFGVLTQVRDMTQVLRNDYSRSQSQSAEDPDLRNADPQTHYDSESWILPSSESEYKKGREFLIAYRDRLADPKDRSAQFYARADNLTEYLGFVEKRLGSLAQRLASSVGEHIDPALLEGSEELTGLSEPTPWLEIDDVFYEARGYAYGLVHILKAAVIDFEDVLRGKNALVSLQQIIEELENTQDAIWSPMVLNGNGFGLVANHSLIMASYISRANAGLIDLRKLLQTG